MRLLIPVVLLVFLGGCATQAERAAQKERDAEELVQVYGPACDKLGYQHNSDPWRNCLIGLSTQDNLRRYSFSSSTCFGHRGFLQCTSF